MKGSRKCPYCGEAVPSYSLSCPKCYREIPREEVAEPEPEPARQPGAKNRTLITILSLVPGLFGILGLGLIYQDFRNTKGWIFLGAGLLIFAGLMFSVRMIFAGGWFGSAVALIISLILGLIYLSAYIAQAIESVLGSIFTVLKF
jgi:hypothetical protein